MAKAAQPKAKKPATPPRRAAPASPIMTTAQVAELFEISAERVRQLVKSGHIEKHGKDRVPLVPAVRGYIRFLKDEDRRSSKSASASRLQDERTREVALRNAERDGRLIDVVEHRELFAECFGILRTNLSGIPARLTRDMAFRRKIETEINDALRQAADRFDKTGGDTATAGEAAEADAGDDA